MVELKNYDPCSVARSYPTPAHSYALALGGPTCNAKVISIFSNIQHYAVYVSTIGNCMPSRRLWRLDAPLLLLGRSV